MKLDNHSQRIAIFADPGKRVEGAERVAEFPGLVWACFEQPATYVASTADGGSEGAIMVMVGAPPCLIVCRVGKEFWLRPTPGPRLRVLERVNSFLASVTEHVAERPSCSSSLKFQYATREKTREEQRADRELSLK